MKYKMIGICACVCAVILSVLAVFLTSDHTNRYHQHMEAEKKTPCTDHGDETFCTHLPLVQIDTGGEEIPGKTIIDESGRKIGYTQSSEGEDEIRAYIKVTDHEKTNNHIGDESSVESDIMIHVRGNSSRAFDKSSYAIRLITENGENNSQSIMGVDAHHEWVLHGPYLDKSLMRNYMWYNIAGEIMDYAPNVRFCEMIVNGEYQGLYVMTENVTAGKDGARLSLSVNKKDNTFTGYILRLDRGSNVGIKNLDTFSKYTYRTLNALDIVYPGTGNLTEELREAIRQDFSDFEKMLYSYDYDNKKYGYENVLDTQSFVDYFLINEFTCNYDAGRFSTYIYKDVDSRYRMCVWDFNSACDNYQESMMDTSHFEMQNRLWYTMLFKDENFTDAVIKRYQKLRKSYLSEEYLNQYIEDVKAYLGDAIERNYEKWGYSFEEPYDLLTPADRNLRNYDEVMEQLKEFIHVRGEWMDENIEILRQYSAASKVKKFNEHTE